MPLLYLIVGDSVSAQLIAMIVDNLISIVSGIIAILLGFRVIGPQAGTSPQFDAFYKNWGKPLKWLGALIIFSTLAQFGLHFYHP